MEMDMERLKVLSLSDQDSDCHSQVILSPPSSPSGRLPIELLSEIFLLCVGSALDPHHTIHTPLLVSKICSRWRSAAIANHKLWSRLYLDLTPPNSRSLSPSSPRFNSPSPPSSPISSTSQKNMVETWLARSGACPLTVYVLWEGRSSSFTHPVLDALAEHCTRWHTMYFYLPFPAFRSFSRIRNRLPMLTGLSLGVDDRDIPTGVAPVQDNKVDIFENAPRLRSLECVTSSLTMFKLPWNQLEDILLGVNIDEALDILRRAKRLVKVGFMFGNLTAPWHTTPHLPNSPTAPHRYIDHHHLRCFTLMTPRWNEPISLKSLFPHLAFPQLESLTICNLKAPFGREFTQFLSRLHVLKTLHLRRTALSDEQLVEGLKYLPSLAELIVHSSDGMSGQEPEATVTRYLFGALTRNFFSSSVDDDDGMLLPRLKSLEMTLDSYMTLAALDALLEMLQSRLREDGVGGIVRLENVRLRSFGVLDEEFLIRLIELRDFGLAVSIEGAGERGMDMRD